MRVGYKDLIERAEANIESISIEAAEALLENDDTVFVDIRDIRELQREGKLPGATHAPRGMLEFWVDPESPYHRELFAEKKRFVFYCASAWRSALATDTVQTMGMENVCHMAGGFSAWKEAGKAIEKLEPKNR
ncbi:MAG: rhodanese [Gammaproteobacteria bacterium]|jgi:rhodanese-related sulfurtransferase|nr:rhodanese [Gammaproteobacteria bacterium]|tara:strand:- start:145 stop:543 length:399 start_codon:yes stop_codon:yes gene_type:complete